MAETFFQEGDVQPMLDGPGGVSVTVGSTTVKGQRCSIDDELFRNDAGAVAGRIIAVIVKTGAFSGLAEGVNITVEGTAYKVVQQRRLDDGPFTDGALTRVLCALP